MVSGKPVSTGQFFEGSTLLVTLIVEGRWVGALACQKAVESVSVQSLQAPTAVVVTDDGGR
jgi:Cu2+-exporting ATPase